MYAQELELELAAQELENYHALHGAEGETGLGAATALVNLVNILSSTNGLATPAQQQAALRVGQAQLNAGGQSLRRVAVPGAVAAGTLNKPDVSYVYQDPATHALRRMNVEIDTNINESRRHRAIVNGRDPNARNLFVMVDPWTGQIRSARVREPGTSRMTNMPRSQLAGLFQSLPRVATPAAGRGASRRTRLREFEAELEGELEAAAAELEGLVPA